LIQKYDWKKRSMRPSLIFSLVALSILIASGAHAGGLYTNEFATTAQANAGAGRGAWAPDASAALHNPATMTQLDDHGFATGFSIATGNVRFDPDSNSPSGAKDGGSQAGVAPISSLNYVHRISERVRFGFSFYSISGSILNPNDDWAGRFELTEISLLTISLSPTLAIEITDWLSIGGGPIATYGVLNWDMKIATPGPGEEKVKLDDFDDWKAAGRVGILLQPTKSLSISAYYNSKTDFEFNGRIRGPGGLNPSVNADLPLAQVVEVSAAWQVTEQTALLATFNWEDWSEADDLDVSAFGQTVGVSTGFNDTYKIAAGINHQLRDDWLLQMGVSFDTSALKAKDRTSALPIDQQIRVAAGFQYDWSDSLVLGGSFVWANLGQGEIRSPTLRGDYKHNDVFVVGVTLSYKSLPWAGKATL
jgi:long-chain fatty acid transport protein